MEPDDRVLPSMDEEEGDRWARGLAVYASQFGIDTDEVFEFMRAGFGETMATEAIHAAGGAWREQVLSFRDRSLVVLAALVTQGAVDDRLRLHARWALSNGVSPDQLEAAVALLAIYSGYPRASVAMEIVRDVLDDESRQESS